VDLERTLGGRGQQLRDEITAQLLGRLQVEESPRRVLTPETANQTLEMAVKALVPGVRAGLAPE